MPSSIPYDPSLVLANVVNKDALDIVTQISQLQGPVDAAQEELNSLVAMRRSFDMTKSELANLNVPTDDIDKETIELNARIQASAVNYAKAKVAAETGIQPLRAKIQSVHASVESPVDYMKTEIKTMPLAIDSLNMDVQYFSLDSNSQSSDDFASQISAYVSASVSWLGNKAAMQVSGAAAKQVNQQTQNHSIAGTLVLSVSCTHKNAKLLAPFALNVDKGVKVWNRLFPDNKLIPTNTSDMVKLASADDPDGADSFSIISGMTFGSSFVGMVHVLNNTDTSVSERISNITSSLQATLDTGSWLENASGGFGVNASVANDVKNLLSTQNITSHVTLISMGVIPSIVANDVKMAIQQFQDGDPMAEVQKISAATAADFNSVQSSADAARTGQQMVSYKASGMQSAVRATAEVQDASNKMLDINSMMTALDDYLSKASTGDCGVPLNYYLKDITKSMLAEMWVAKYFPGQYLTISSDDVVQGGPAHGGNSTMSATPDSSSAPPPAS